MKRHSLLPAGLTCLVTCLVACLVACLALTVPARADTSTVQIVDTAYNPPLLAVLAGDTVGWRNSSFINQHTVTSATFDSGPIVPGGGFFHDFPAPGTYLYACTIHLGMSGEVDVFGLLMSGPERAVARGAATVLTGRAAAGTGSITLEEDTGAGFHPVATTQASGGSFKATVHPPANATYRAVGGANASPPVQVQVSDRSDIAVKVSGRRLRVHVDPANPGARVSLQLKLRERFGWWTVARARLDKRSGVGFTVRRSKPVRARVVLTRSDGWTPLATSPAVRVRPRR
jgi:plastocyanin